MMNQFLGLTLACLLVCAVGDTYAGENAPDNPTRLSGLVYNDLNENALYDENEVPAMGIIVDLLDEDARFVQRDLTGEDGVYSFEGIDPGVYFLRFEFVPGFAVRSRGLEVGLKPAPSGKSVVSAKSVLSGKEPLPSGKGFLFSGKEPIRYDEGSDEWVFVPVPVVKPSSNYSFPRLQLVSPANFKGNEVSPFAP